MSMQYQHNSLAAQLINYTGKTSEYALRAGFSAAREQCLHYDELITQVHDTAKALAELDVNCVALCADNSPRWLLVDLACQAAGIALLPLPLYFSAQQIDHALTTCAADLLLTDNPATITQYFDGAKQSHPIAGYYTARRTLNQCAQLPDGSAKITFTSGSTGNPKGVCLTTSHQLAVANSLVDALALPEVRHLCVLPLTTLLENVAGAYAPLLAGGEVIVPPLGEIGFNGSASFDAQQFLAALQTYEPESLILLPQLLSLLVSAVEQGYPLPGSLKFIAVGGARVSPALLARAHTLGIPVYEGYGLSECTSVVSLNLPDDGRLGSAGKVLGHNRVRVEHGELVITGNCFLGYAGEPSSWYPQEVATGDMGELDESGYVTLLGRRKNLLISSFGRNINPEWIESELLASTEIAQAIVVGDDQAFCSALIFPRHSDVSAAALAKHIDKVNARLPDYAQIKRWCSLPLHTLFAQGFVTANGRPMRGQIIEHYAAVIADFYLQTAQGTYL